MSQMLLEIKNELPSQDTWSKFERKYQNKKLDEITFVGYGSLLNAKSAAQTFPNLPYADFKPIIAFGVRRLFNYNMPNYERYGSPDNPINSAALNVRYTGKIKDVVNGILLKLPIKFLPDLRKREVDYDLIPVVCKDWFNSRKSFFISHILSCPEKIKNGYNRINNKILPHIKYYKTCREGASKLGEKFLYFWLNSTYLADGITPIAKWEVEKYLNLNKKNQILKK